MDIVSDFTFTEPESLTNVQSSPAKTINLSGSEDYGSCTTFSGDHNYCSSGLKEEHDTEQENVAKVIVESQQVHVYTCTLYGTVC